MLASALLLLKYVHTENGKQYPKNKKNYVKFIELFGFTSLFFLVCNFFINKKIRPTVEMIDEALLSFCDIEWFDKKTFDDDMF